MDKKKILVADDEPQMLQMVEMRLQAAGYDVITAADGEEALSKTKKEQPDLLILDVMMPKMDGYKVCGLLKADGRYNKIPIILFTARAQAADKQLSEELGADAYLTKPLKDEELIQTVNNLLKKT